jgi:carbon-monoxide dehydrogenase medium subunit
VKPAPVAYVRAESTDQVLALLAEHGDEAKILAGGQSLVPLLNMRFARPAVLVDVNGIRGADDVLLTNERVRVGSLVRQAAFGASPIVREHLPLAAECVPYIGHFVTRNRGTVTGSIVHADARAELPLVLTALGGRVSVHSAGGGFRTIPANNFFLTHFTTVVEPTDFVVETLWPAARPGSGFAFEELALRRGDYALAMVAVALRNEGGRAVDTRIAIGAVADRPRLLADLAARIDGNAVDAALAREAGSAARVLVDAADTLHASAAYQRHLTGALVERALLRAWVATGGQG